FSPCLPWLLSAVPQPDLPPFRPPVTQLPPLPALRGFCLSDLRSRWQSRFRHIPVHAREATSSPHEHVPVDLLPRVGSPEETSEIRCSATSATPCDVPTRRRPLSRL